MRTGLTISTVAHAAFLLWSVFTLAAKPFDSQPMESMPIDIVTADQFSKMTKGQIDAKKAEVQKPLVEKVAEAKPAEELTKKVTEKKEIAPTAEQTPPPPTEAKPEKKPDKAPEAKSDPIAEALKKDEAQKPKKAEAKPPVPQKKPAPPQPKFDPAKVAALLDKRAPQRQAATGATVNSVPSAGTPSGEAAILSQSELDALRARLSKLWNAPTGMPADLMIVIRVRLRPDGTHAIGPQVLTSGRGPMFEAARDSAVIAILRGQPFNMLRPENYETWKEMDIGFDPSWLSRG